MENKERLYQIRHSAAHLLAQAVLELFPGTQLTIGPVTEEGFFYDFLPPKNFTEGDLPAIEKRMHEIAAKDFPIVGRDVPKEEARALYKDNRFKLELIDEIEDDTVGIYSQGDFFDLCKGGHVDSIGELKHFKLTAVSGSYWRANREGQPLQRIYGVAFETKQELDSYLKRIEDAKMYDHRRLGKQLDLFTFHEEAAGFPFFHPKGLHLYNTLISFARLLQKEYGYKEIKAPLVLDESLWKTSGHYDFYRENMYFTSIDDLMQCLRPMNCPGSILLYKEKIRSYRDLPLRMAEFGLVHRKELSGVLHGLFRLRGFTIDDAHIYCTLDHLEDEVVKVLELADDIYCPFGFSKIKMELSTRPEKSIGSDEYWEKGTAALQNALTRRKVPFVTKEGEGAFYGPKIDIVICDSMGREWQCGTAQVDFFLPMNFKLEYIDADQSRKTPIILHRAIFGSVERFLGIILEHFKGVLPFWLAPVQARILVITDAQRDYAQNLARELQAKGIRVELDMSGDQISAQIRRAQLEKLPWMLVVGKKEQSDNTVTLRQYDGKQEFGLSMNELLSRARELNTL